MQKWRNSDVHQSVEQKYQLVDIGILVSLLEPKIDYFSSFGPRGDLSRIQGRPGVGNSKILSCTKLSKI